MEEKKLVSKRVLNMIKADGIILSYTLEYIYSNGEVVRKDYVKPEEEVKKEFKELKKRRKALKKAMKAKEDDEMFEETLLLMEMMDI